jgi:Ca2+-binding RTX toxin-like protein
LVGVRGKDILIGGDGGDELRAGNGRDIINGGDGSDTMYGGFGLNTFEDEADGEIDRLFLKSDQHAYNWIYDKDGNSPNGEKADKITELDPFDEIYVQGVETSQLSYGSVNHTSRGEMLSGIGIYASGVLEAVYMGDDLSLGQIEAMTQGIL